MAWIKEYPKKQRFMTYCYDVLNSKPVYLAVVVCTV